MYIMEKEFAIVLIENVLTRYILLYQISIISYAEYVYAIKYNALCIQHFSCYAFDF